MEELSLSAFLKKKYHKGIVVLTGLPSTCKTEVAQRLAGWAHFPVLCIDDFLGGGGWSCSFDRDYSPPATSEEVELNYRKAFLGLLNAAQRHLETGVCNCVIIKASLNTSYEFQLLLQLTRGYENQNVFKAFTLIIMECKVSNEYKWKYRFEDLISIHGFYGSRRWSRPRSWNDMEKVMDDDCAAQPPSRDLHLPSQRNRYDEPSIIWLVVDPFYDLFVDHKFVSDRPLPDEFNDAIKYLLTPNIFPQNPYVVEYDELRRFLFDEKIKEAAMKGRSEAFCHGDCVFKYTEALEDSEANFCGACANQTIISGPAYTCHFCIASLHKTCAERIDIKDLQYSQMSAFYDNPNYLKVLESPCRSCKWRGREISEKCTSSLFQKRLPCHMVPTVINHDCHKHDGHNHFLSIQLSNLFHVCKACGGHQYACSYGCKRCGFYCHLTCALLPLVLKHRHGGHEHVMNLMFSRDGMDKEELCWCDFCYEDMDPELWFYSCQTCPHYVVHLECTGAYRRNVYDPVMVKFVEQLQSQLEDWSAARNAIDYESSSDESISEGSFSS